MSKKNSTKPPIRNYATILYPESAKDDWLKTLEGLHVKILISPLHNMDVDEDGVVKKEHYHIMYVFDGKKTENQIKEINDMIGAVGIERVNSLKGYARYLCHLDEKDKARYPVSDVQALGGIKYEEVIKEAADKYKVSQEILSFCKQNGIIAYCDIVDYAIGNNMEWYMQLVDNSHLYINYLKSYGWKRSEFESYTLKTLKKYKNDIN